MRVDDRPLPNVTLDAVPMLAGWPVRPVIAIDSGQALAEWDSTPAAKWDTPGTVWDGGFIDATCAFTGMEIEHGEPDTANLFPSSRCVVQLDNADGAWSTLNADGTINRYGPGTALAVWAHNATGDWWLFNGFVARYDQRADDTIEIEAFDALSDLAQPVGTYTPGTNGQLAGARLTAILTAAGETTMPTRFATGIAALTAQETDAAPIEEMQAVALSDGGLIFVDVDGAVMFIDRTWTAGRADQVTVPITSDNVCTAPVIVWDAVISTNDDNLADRVILENVAGLVATAGAASGYTIALTDQQWTTQTEGDILAALYLDQQEPRQMSIEEFSLYLNDPNQPDIWAAVDWRRVDHLRFLHDQRVIGGTVRVDVTTVLDGIIHQVTPEGWTMIVSTAKARAFTEPIFYDTGILYDTGEGYGY